MRRLLLFLVTSAFVFATPTLASADDLEVVRVHRADGSVVPGFIVEKRVDGILVRGADGDVFIGFDEIDEIEYIASPVEAEMVPRPTVRTHPPAVHLADPADVYLQHPSWGSYAKSRLVMTDRRGDRIGPAVLGFSSRDFGRDDNRPYRILVAGQAISLEEFVDLAGSHELMRKYDIKLEKAQVAVDFGWGLVMASVTMGGFGWPLAIGGASAGQSEPAFVGPGLIGWSVFTLVMSAVLHKRGYANMKRLSGTDFYKFVDRRDAWPHVQNYNSGIRQELGIPDDEEADAQ